MHKEYKCDTCKLTIFESSTGSIITNCTCKKHVTKHHSQNKDDDSFLDRALDVVETVAVASWITGLFD